MAAEVRKGMLDRKVAAQPPFVIENKRLLATMKSQNPFLQNGELFETYIRDFTMVQEANQNGIEMKTTIEISKNIYYSTVELQNKMKSVSI